MVRRVWIEMKAMSMRQKRSMSQIQILYGKAMVFIADEVSGNDWCMCGERGSV